LPAPGSTAHESKVLLDAHQHFWRYDAVQYPWIPPVSPLHRDWLPADLAALQRPLGIAGSIAVQARQSLAESDWLLGLADADERIRAVVGWVDLRGSSLGDDLARLARHPKFVGVRHVVQDEPDDRFLLGASFCEGIRLLKDFDLTYDLLIYPQQLPAAIELVERFPEQPFVLDHLAKPSIRTGTLEPWREQIRELAKAPGVFCKVSGMITEADHANWSPSDLRPFIDVVFEEFGVDRLMWGSDWPVCLFADSYDRVFQVVDDYLSGFSNRDRDAVMGGNCARFYLEP
jgi:L-fuconolactonase